MFNTFPTSDDGLWLLEHVLFGWWWHPIQWFGWILVAAIVIAVVCEMLRATLELIWRAVLLAGAAVGLFVLPASAWTSHGPCVPSETNDCQGGYYAGSMTQCPSFDFLVCSQFETPGDVCYGIRNPLGCIAGSGARHFRRPIVDMTKVPMCPVWETGRQWVARPCP